MENNNIENLVLEENKGNLKKKIGAVIERIKSIPKKILIPVLVGVLVVLVGVGFLSAFTGNTYKTPLKIEVELMNSRKCISPIKSSIKMLNGFAKNEFSEMFEIINKTEFYEEELEDYEEYYLEYIENLEDEYGENFRFSFKITDKEKLEKEELRDFRNELREVADEIEEIIDEIDYYDSDDWEEIADDFGTSKTEAKKLVKTFEKIGKKYKEAKVTAGYKLDILLIIKGRELDEPEEMEIQGEVYKVNGRWVAKQSATLEEIIDFMYEF